MAPNWNLTIITYGTKLEPHHYTYGTKFLEEDLLLLCWKDSQFILSPIDKAENI